MPILSSPAARPEVGSRRFFQICALMTLAMRYGMKNRTRNTATPRRMRLRRNAPRSPSAIGTVRNATR